MSDTVQLAVVAGIVAIATLIIKAIIDAHAKKVELVAATVAAAAKAAADAASEKVNHRLAEVEIKIDGRLSQLLEIATKAALAEGKIQGKAEEKEQHKIEVIETHTLPIAGTTNLKIVEGEIKVKTEPKKK